MPKKTYRVGIVGLGGIAERPPDEAPPPFSDTVSTSHAGALAQMSDFEVAGVCDLVPDLLEQFDRDWGSRWPTAAMYTDYKEMLAKGRLDILTVATSDHLHADIAVDAANAGVKGIFVEKPLATSMEDADRIVKACEENDAALVVDHTWRWDPLYHRVRAAIREGSIGKLSTIVVMHTGARAMLFRNGTHKIDGVCFFAESEPDKVFARLEDGFDDWDRYRGDGGKLPENDPSANGFILFKNGVQAHYCGDKEAFQDSSYLLVGKKGQITVTPWGAVQDRTAELVTNDPQTGEAVRKTLVPGQYLVRNLGAAYRELGAIAEKGGASVSPGREARKTVQIMVGFLNSHQQGSRLVDVPE